MDPISDENITQKDSFEELTPEISEKNTKGEIVKAYQTLAKKYEDRVKGGKVKQAKTTSGDEAVEKAGGHTVATLIAHMEEMKRKMAEALNTLTQQLAGEAKKLGDINQAIVVQQERLKSFYDIETAAVGLEDIIKAQEEKKEAFETEYRKIKVVRQQEEQDYGYQKERERKREVFAREDEEEALKKRKEALAQQEAEIKELRKKVESFPHELRQAVEEAKRETADQTRKEMQMQADLIAKEASGEKKVLETRIAFFDDLIARQKEEIVSLKKEADQAMRQVQSIAEKAIEGSAGKQTLKAVNDIALQQARGSKSEE